MSIHPVTSDDAKKLQPLIDSVSASMQKIRAIGERRSERLQQSVINNVADRLDVFYTLTTSRLCDALELAVERLQLSDEDRFDPTTLRTLREVLAQSETCDPALRLEHAARIANAVLGLTREPVKAVR